MKENPTREMDVPATDPDFAEWESRILAWSQDNDLETPDFASIRRRRVAQLRFRHWLYGIAATLVLGCGLLFAVPQFIRNRPTPDAVPPVSIASVAVAVTTGEASETTEAFELSWDTEANQIAELRPEVENLGTNFNWKLSAFDPIQMEE